MVGMTLGAKDSLGGVEMYLSELVIVRSVEGPRHTLEQQGLSRLGLQQADLQSESGGRHTA